MGRPTKWTQESIIERFREKHGDKYDYSEVVFETVKNKVKIKCKTCGTIFWQSPDCHARGGQGCPVCAGVQKGTTESFIKKAKRKHGAQYDYSRFVYRGSHTKGEIVCNSCGQSFFMSPTNHLTGNGCPVCANQKRRDTLRHDNSMFIEKCKSLRVDKAERYDYSKVQYVDAHTPIEIVCSKHGSFWQTPDSHLKGSGCPHCQQSLLEQTVESILKELEIKYTPQWSPGWLHRQRCDFYLPEYNKVIECQGIQHYQPIMLFNKSTSFERIVELDELKLQRCGEHGITIIYIKYNEKDIKSKLLKILKKEVN